VKTGRRGGSTTCADCPSLGARSRLAKAWISWRRFSGGSLTTLACLVFVAAAVGQVPAHYRSGADGVILPDPQVTPGATRPVAAADLCPIAHTKLVRHVTPAQKHRIYARYGATPEPGVCCEVDHLIPLELGGSNDEANLWPQPYSPAPGAHEKDVLETFLHGAVCGGAMTLEEAQQKIAGDWYGAYQEMRTPAPDR
jgi:hypothetical protein